MKVFLDANVIMEYLAKRLQSREASIVMRAAEQRLIVAVASSMTMATVAYLLGTHMKRQGFYEPEKHRMVRDILNDLLQYVTVVDLSHVCLVDALRDSGFTDIEDSFQFYCALEHNCDCFLTINVKDFPAERGCMTVLSLGEFISRHVCL